jgi:hypothetical protein
MQTIDSSLETTVPTPTPNNALQRMVKFRNRKGHESIQRRRNRCFYA